MPKLIDKLNQQQRSKLLLVVSNLQALDSQALKILDKQNLHKTQLESVSSKEEFFKLVEEISQSSADADKILLGITQHIDKEILAALTEYVNNDAQLTMIWDALHFSSSMRDFIIATKERLSEKELFERFDDKRKEMVLRFFSGIQAIKPMADILNKQREIFRQELLDCSSINEVNKVEDRIDAHQQAAATIYEKEVLFPKDEGVAGAIIQYLELNPQVRAIMTSFDLAESLTDDVFAAKMKCNAGNAPKM